MTVYCELSFAGVEARTKKEAMDWVKLALEKLAQERRLSYRIHEMFSPSGRIIQDNDD